MNSKDNYRKARNFLIWSGLICELVAQPLPIAFSIILSIIGIGIVLCGCWNWAKYKGRNGWWAAWGLLAPIGLIALANMKDEYKEIENTIQEIPQKQEKDRLTRTLERVE